MNDRIETYECQECHRQYTWEGEILDIIGSCCPVCITGELVLCDEWGPVNKPIKEKQHDN